MVLHSNDYYFHNVNRSSNYIGKNRLTEKKDDTIVFPQYKTLIYTILSSIIFSIILYILLSRIPQ